MTELETLRAKLEALEATLAAVRRHLIHSHAYNSWLDCGICNGQWRDGYKENHAPSCPLEESRPVGTEAKKPSPTVYSLQELFEAWDEQINQKP